MNSILEVINKIKSGVPLIDAIPEGADVATWRKIIANRANPGKSKRRRSGGSRASKRSQYSRMQSVISGATLELVKRVNEEAAIPFDGVAPDDSGDESSEEARCGLPPAF